jgi:hypothetical protein
LVLDQSMTRGKQDLISFMQVEWFDYCSCLFLVIYHSITNHIKTCWLRTNIVLSLMSLWVGWAQLDGSSAAFTWSLSAAVRWPLWLDVHGSYFTHIWHLSVPHGFLHRAAKGAKMEEAKAGSSLRFWAQKSQNISCTMFFWSQPGTKLTIE